MKQIRKICVSLLVICILFANTQFVNAETTSNNIKTDILSELKILKGNGVSLDLDSQLSRSEAAAFIVRLLGEEEKVIDNKAKYSDTNFSDVPKDKWYATYIGYCVEKGIIDGYKDNTFKPDDKLGEKAFLKLVLTAIGYKYNDDFKWNNVFETAYGVGLVKDTSYASGHVEDKKYTRGKVVDILFTALQLQHADTKIRMAQKFIDNGSITKKQALEYSLIDDEFETEITSIEAINATTIEVTFNEKIQPFTPENILIYEASGTTEVLPIEDITRKDTTDTYVITTAQEQKMDEEYTLLIDKIVDIKGNPSNSFSEIFIGYRADEIDSDFFKVSKIKSISNNVIYVYFTQPINDNALQSAFYTVSQDDIEIIKGDNTNILVNKLATCDNGISIYFKNYLFTIDDFFKLNIDGQLSSIYGVRLNDGEGDMVKFKASVEQNEAFTVEDCIPINTHMIQINFNKEVNPSIAKQVFMYYITDENDIPIQVTKAEVVSEGDGAGKSVRLTLASSIRVNKEYKILINNMSDITRQFSIIDKEYSFIGSYYSTNSIDIEAVVSVDDNTLMVYISEPLDQVETEDVSNYQIHGVTDRSFITIPTAVYYDKKNDPNLIKIYLSSNKPLKKSHKYNFRIISLKDSLGKTQSTLKSKEFRHSSSKTGEIYIKDAKVIGNNTIKLNFNKEVAFDINNVLNTNYTLSYSENGLEYNKIPLGANFIDPSTIILNFDILDTDKEYEITFKKLIDYGKNETNNKDGRYSCDVTIGD